MNSTECAPCPSVGEVDPNVHANDDQLTSGEVAPPQQVDSEPPVSAISQAMVNHETKEEIAALRNALQQKQCEENADLNKAHYELQQEHAELRLLFEREVQKNAIATAAMQQARQQRQQMQEELASAKTLLAATKGNLQQAQATISANEHLVAGLEEQLDTARRIGDARAQLLEMMQSDGTNPSDVCDDG